MRSRTIDEDLLFIEDRKLSSGERRLVLLWMEQINTLVEGDLQSGPKLARLEKLSAAAERLITLLKIGLYEDQNLSKSVCLAIIEALVEEDGLERTVDYGLKPIRQ